MKHHNMQYFGSENDQNTAVVERFDRTIKISIWTYLTDLGTVCCVYVIKSLWTRTTIFTTGLLGWRQQTEQRPLRHTQDTSYNVGDTHLKPPMPHGLMVRISKKQSYVWQGIHAQLVQIAFYRWSDSNSSSRK